MRTTNSAPHSQEPTSFDAPYRVLAIEHPTAAITELWLGPLQAPLDYEPGQYVLIEDRDRQTAPRSYSIANAPRADGRISLLITRVAGGETSPWLCERLAPGDEVSITGPYGSFVADPSSTAPVLLLAAGSGLAPIRALIEAALAESDGPELTLIFSARTAADVLDSERFERWSARDRRLRFEPVLTREEGGSRRRVPELLPELCGGLSAHDVFVAGAPGFVGACADAAAAQGARQERIRTEEFFV